MKQSMNKVLSGPNLFHSIIMTESKAGFFVLLGGVSGLNDSMFGDLDLFSAVSLPRVL